MADVMTRPVTEGEQQEADRSPMQVVERFLALLCAKDVDGASDLLAEDVEYVNVGLPAVHGRERVRRLLRVTLGRPGAGLEVYTHTAATLRGLLGVMIPPVRAKPPVVSAPTAVTGPAPT